MKTSCLLLLVFVIIGAARCLAASSPGVNLLTVGDQAPPLAVDSFLKGQSVARLEKGAVYVIEFSATTCAPCVRELPRLTALQKKLPHVIFISIYSQGAGDTEPDVRKFLSKHGDQMGFRVAMDREGTMWREWELAAGFSEVPLACLVDAHGHIAWIGVSTDLDTRLNNLLAGKPVHLRRERMLLYFDQALNVAGAASKMRDQRCDEMAKTQHDHLMKHEWDDVIRIGEEGARDFPENEFYFSWHKLYALSHNPQTTDQALKFAAELSARTPYSFDENYGLRGPLGQEASDANVQIARFLVDEEANGDPLLADAAIILINKAREALSRIKDPKRREEEQSYIQWISASIAAKKGDFATASALAQESIILLKKQTNPESTDEERKIWDAQHQQMLTQRQDVLIGYEKAATEIPTMRPEW